MRFLERLKYPRPSLRGLLMLSAVLVGLTFSPMGRWAFVPGPSKAEIALDRRLADVRFENADLEDALGSIARQAGVALKLHPNGLYRDIKFGGPVTLHLRDVTVREAIEAAFAASGADIDGLGIDPAGSEIHVGARDRMSPSTIVRLYDLNDLAEHELGGRKAGSRAQSRSDIAHDVGDALFRWFPGKRAAYERVHGTRLVIRCSPENHRQSARIIAMLSASASQPGQETGQRAYQPVNGSSFEAKIADLDLRDVTLSEAIDQLQAMTPVNFVVANGVRFNRRFSLHVRDVTFEQALDMVLRAAPSPPPGLSLRYGGGAFITIVSSEKEDGTLAVHDVRFLVDEIVRTDRGNVRPSLIRSVAASLIQADLKTGLQPGSFGGEPAFFGEQLLAEQTPANHRRIGILLESFVQRISIPKATDIGPFQTDSPAIPRIIGNDQPYLAHYHGRAADMPFVHDLNLDGMTIVEAMTALSGKADARLAFDIDRIAVQQINFKTPIHLLVRDVSLPDAIRLAFDAVSPPGTVRVSDTFEAEMIWIR